MPFQNEHKKKCTTKYENKDYEPLRKELGENRDDLWCGDNLLDPSVKTWSMNKITTNLGFMKIKSVTSVKYNVKEMTKRVTEGWQLIFPKSIVDQFLLFKTDNT